MIAARSHMALITHNTLKFVWFGKSLQSRCLNTAARHPMSVICIARMNTACRRALLPLGQGPRSSSTTTTLEGLSQVTPCLESIQPTYCSADHITEVSTVHTWGAACAGLHLQNAVLGLPGAAAAGRFRLVRGISGDDAAPHQQGPPPV